MTGCAAPSATLAAARRATPRFAPAWRRNWGACALFWDWRGKGGEAAAAAARRPLLEAFPYLGSNFVGAQPLSVIEYLRGDHQFLGPRPLHERRHRMADGLARTR